MLTRVRYSPRDFLMWTRWELLWFIGFSTLVTGLYLVADLRFLHLPWAPLAVVGTAVAFIVGFQNNAAYDRIWEARKIWGGIVNTSRTFAMKTIDMISAEHATEPVTEEELDEQRKEIVYRHLAWLTALRHAMRQPRSWEEFARASTNREWAREAHIPEKIFSLEDELFQYLLDDDEFDRIEHKTNKATSILFCQSEHLRKLKERGLIWSFAFLELENALEELFTLQGKSERIKNFPYPRQYATLSFQFVRIFIFLFPFAAVPEFAEIGEGLVDTWPRLAPYFAWAAIPFCTIVAWLFHTMERIGRVGENPFEGSANDVPISTICRGIEIDLREQLGEDPEMIPKPLPESYDIQM